jgi:hypothetical protein
MNDGDVSRQSILAPQGTSCSLGNSLKVDDLPYFAYSDKSSRLNWRNLQSVRINASGLQDDPAFEDVLKNFVGARLVEDDLDRIGDERMLKIILLDQLMIEYLMSVQDSLIEEVARAEQGHAQVAAEKAKQQEMLEMNKQAVDDLREELARKGDQVNQLKTCRQQLSAFRCCYCSKMFKTLYYLEKHMIRHEATNLRLEKEADMRIAEQKAREIAVQMQQQELERQKTSTKEIEFEKVKSEITELKNQLAHDHNEKVSIENKLLKVNQELTENLRRMEQELNEKLKALQEIKSQQAAPAPIILPSPSQNPGGAQQPYYSNAGLGAQPQTQTIGPNMFSSFLAPGQAMTGIVHTANSILPPTHGDKSAANQPNPSSFTTSQTPGLSRNLAELIQQLLIDNEQKGFTLAPGIKTDLSREGPHPQVVSSVSNALTQQGLSLENPMQTEKGRMLASQIFEVMRNGLIKDRLMVGHSIQNMAMNPQLGVPNPQNAPIQEKPLNSQNIILIKPQDGVNYAHDGQGQFNPSISKITPQNPPQTSGPISPVPAQNNQATGPKSPPVNIFQALLGNTGVANTNQCKLKLYQKWGVDHLQRL